MKYLKISENQENEESFYKNILSNTRDIEPEILEVINEHYWDLL